METAQPPNGRALWLVASLLLLLALADSVWLYYLQGAEETMAQVCQVAEGFDCAPALKSRYSSFQGISLSSFAISTYVFLAALAIQGLWNPVRRARNAFLLSFLLAGSTLFCAWLAYVSAVKLKAYCPYCLVLHITTPAALIPALLLLWRRLDEVGAALREELKGNRWLFLVLIVILGATAVGLPVYDQFHKEKILMANPSYREIMEGKAPRLQNYVKPAGIDFLLSHPSRGNPEAPVTIVEFGDFTCGVCAGFSRQMEDLMEVYDLRHVFVPYPRGAECNPTRSETMPESCFGALVAKFAESRGRFWIVHDALFDNPSLLRNKGNHEALAKLAGASSLAEIEADTGALLAVFRDVQFANAIPVRKTPTLLINGMGHEGVPSSWFLEELIEREMDRAREAKASLPRNSGIESASP